MYRRPVVGTLAGLVALIAAPAAMAASAKTVSAGPPPSTTKIAAKYVPKSFVGRYNPDFNAFFRQRTTVQVGGTVTFQLRGFHTVDLPGKAGTALPVIAPQSSLVSGVNDAAGNPFWFNGRLPNLSFNPALLAPSKVDTYDGTTRVDSGLPAGKPKPLTVEFTKAGTYKYYCDVHPGMVGYVVVKPKTASVPTAKQDTAAVTAQVTADVKSAKKLAASKPPANTVDLGVSASGGVELFGMFPATLQVNAGTVVTFTMSRRSFETHTATFGPNSYLTPLAKAFAGAPTIPANAAYPSDPVQPLTLTPTSHGNGFANTGVLDTDPASATVPSSAKIDFTKPGTYHFVCLVHPFMRGTIVVK
jgi:plastocyanin